MAIDDISPQLFKYRYHFGIAIFVSLICSLLLYAAPRLLSILGYFWPLFASTTLFLVAVIAFGGVSQLSTETHGETQGQGIIDYVAGRPEYTN
ncbi:unnamed protein product [Prunus brigantina]